MGPAVNTAVRPAAKTRRLDVGVQVERPQRSEDERPGGRPRRRDHGTGRSAWIFSVSLRSPRVFVLVPVCERPDLPRCAESSLRRHDGGWGDPHTEKLRSLILWRLSRAKTWRAFRLLEQTADHHCDCGRDAHGSKRRSGGLGPGVVARRTKGVVAPTRQLPGDSKVGSLRPETFAK